MGDAWAGSFDRSVISEALKEYGEDVSQWDLRGAGEELQSARGFEGTEGARATIGRGWRRLKSSLGK